MKTWKKLLIAAVILAVLILATEPVWMPRMTVLMVRSEFQGNPDVSAVATRRELAAVAPGGKIYSFQNASFTVPWKTLVATRGNGVEDKMFSFAGKGNASSTVLFYTSTETATATPDLLSSLRKLPAGADIKTTRDLYAAMLHLTPADLHISDPVADSQLKALLLLLKKVQIVTWGNPVYTFKNTQGVEGYIFTRDDTTKYVTFFTPAGEAYNLAIIHATPQEADAIIQSLRF